MKVTKGHVAGGEELSNDRTDPDVALFSSSDHCCSRINCAKHALFLVNIIVWASGAALVGVGIWSRLQRTPLAVFDHVTVDVAYLLIGIGAVMFVVSLLGCLGALRLSLLLLKMFVGAVVVVFVVQMVAGVLSFVFLDRVESTMMDLTRDTILHYTPHSQHDIDTLQTQYKCCGGASYQDWEASPLYNCSAALPTSCLVPESCCLQPGAGCTKGKVRRYSESFAQLSIHTRGCIGALMHIFKDNLIMIGLIAFAVGVLQVFCLLVAHCLMHSIVTDQDMAL